MAIPTSDQLALGFGLLGTVMSFFVFLAPVPTFYTICKKKSSEGFDFIPYSVALFSASMLLYYGVLKTNANMIVIINAIACVMELIYLVLYISYASPRSKIYSTMRFILVLNVGLLGVVMAVSLLVFHGSNRVSLVGWICAVVNIAVFASPLTVMGQVIRTKSVEFMPFTLSFFLTLCATTWFFYGFFVKDYYIAFPNILGFLLGIVQMVLYFIYKNHKDHTKSNGANKGWVVDEKNTLEQLKIEDGINSSKTIQMSS